MRSLACHLETHVGARKHLCPVQDCGLTFVQKVGLTKHLESHGESRFKCEHCGNRFFRAESLRNHLNKCHGQEETFQCSYCGQWFVDHDSLKSHSKTKHKVATPGHKPCRLCGDFIPSSSVKKHFKEKHLKDLELEQSPCQFCGLQLSSLLLRSHTRKEHPEEVQDEFLEDPETQELEKMLEEVVGGRNRRSRKQEGHEQEARLEVVEEAEAAAPGQTTCSCPHCGKSLLQQTLKQHLQTVHPQVVVTAQCATDCCTRLEVKAAEPAPANSSNV